jgi:hypothetical protein
MSSMGGHRSKTEPVWQFMPIITALRRLKQEDQKFKASLGYVVILYLKKKEKEEGGGGII